VSGGGIRATAVALIKVRRGGGGRVLRRGLEQEGTL
jgi:hypothetical protein